MTKTRLHFLLGAAIPALFLSGCGGAIEHTLLPSTDVPQYAALTKNAMKADSPETLLKAQGIWQMVEEHGATDPLAMHKKARERVNPVDKSKKQFLPEARLAMAEGARSGEDQKMRILRLRPAEGLDNMLPPRTEIRVAQADIPKLKKREDIQEVLLGGRKPVEKAALGSRVSSITAPTPSIKPEGFSKAKEQKFAALPAAVRQMRFGQHPDKIRLVLDLSNAVQYRADIDADGRTLIVELPETGWDAATQQALQNPLISGYKAQPSGNGGTQLLLQLRKPGRLIGSNALPAASGKGHRIYFDIGAA